MIPITNSAQKINRPSSGRRFAITDIHGCAQTFIKLVNEKLCLTREDQLFLLGDYINKGPDSKGVLDFILDLKAKGYHIYALRGNHEDELLSASKEGSMKMFKGHLKRNHCGGLADEEGRLLPRYEAFFATLPYYYELDDFYLVHAGFNFNVENPLLDLTSMLWTSSFRVDKSFTGNKRIIHGHTPVAYYEITQQSLKQSQCINLDNGCFYTCTSREDFLLEHYGRLCSLNLDTFEIIVQENIDFFDEVILQEKV